MWLVRKSLLWLYTDKKVEPAMGKQFAAGYAGACAAVEDLDGTWCCMLSQLLSSWR